MLALYVFTDVSLILFHRLFVLNSEMWIEEHQPRFVIICFYPLFIICFYPLLTIKLCVDIAW